MASFDTVGASISQLMALKSLFDRKAAEVETLISEITAQVGSPGAPGAVNWVGSVAEQFRGDWAGQFRPNLQKLIQALHETSPYIDRNRRNNELALNGVAS
jgi:uncharacterized protein YukE